MVVELGAGHGRAPRGQGAAGPRQQQRLAEPVGSQALVDRVRAQPVLEAEPLELGDRARGESVAARLVAGEHRRVREQHVVPALRRPGRRRRPRRARADDEHVGAHGNLGAHSPSLPAASSARPIRPAASYVRSASLGARRNSPAARLPSSGRRETPHPERAGCRRQRMRTASLDPGTPGQPAAPAISPSAAVVGSRRCGRALAPPPSSRAGRARYMPALGCGVDRGNAERRRVGRQPRGRRWFWDYVADGSAAPTTAQGVRVVRPTTPDDLARVRVPPAAVRGSPLPPGQPTLADRPEAAPRSRAAPASVDGGPDRDAGSSSTTPARGPSRPARDDRLPPAQRPAARCRGVGGHQSARLPRRAAVKPSPTPGRRA